MAEKNKAPYFIATLGRFGLPQRSGSWSDDHRSTSGEWWFNLGLIYGRSTRIPTFMLCLFYPDCVADVKDLKRIGRPSGPYQGPLPLPHAHQLERRVAHAVHLLLVSCPATREGGESGLYRIAIRCASHSTAFHDIEPLSFDYCHVASGCINPDGPCGSYLSTEAVTVDSFRTSLEGSCSHTCQVSAILTEILTDRNPHGTTAAESILNKIQVS